MSLQGKFKAMSLVPTELRLVTNMMLWGRWKTEGTFIVLGINFTAYQVRLARPGTSNRVRFGQARPRGSLCRITIALDKQGKYAPTGKTAG